MTIEEIERLLRRLERSDITTVEIADDTSSLTLRLGPGFDAPPHTTAIVEAPGAPALQAICAGAIGRLRLRHPEAATESDGTFPRSVLAGDIVAFLEAGPLLRPIGAEKDCTLGPPLRAEGDLVGYGTALFPIL